MGQAQIIILATVMDKDELYLLLLAEMRWLHITADQWVFVQIRSRVMREDFKSFHFIPEERNHEIPTAHEEQP